MKIELNNTIRDKVLDDIRKKRHEEALKSERRKYITLYDLLNPRQAYFQKTDPKPETDEEIMYFTTGKGHEEVLKFVSDLKKGELKHYLGKIGYSQDIRGDRPIEVKTRRGYIPDKDLEFKYSNYIRQIRQYCAVENKLSAELWVWALTGKGESINKTKPDLFTYELFFTKEELEDTRTYIIDTYEMLAEAMQTNDFSKLPMCSEAFYCGSNDRILIKKGYCNTCKKEFATYDGALKHNPEHDMTAPVVENKYTPKCKWYNECRTPTSVG